MSFNFCVKVLHKVCLLCSYFLKSSLEVVIYGYRIDTGQLAVDQRPKLQKFFTVCFTGCIHASWHYPACYYRTKFKVMDLKIMLKFVSKFYVKFIACLYTLKYSL